MKIFSFFTRPFSDLLDENNFTKVYEFVNEAIAKEEIAEQLMVATTTNGLPVFFELTFDTSASLRAVVRMPDFTLAKEDLIEETELANEYYRLISDSLHLSNSNTTFIQADIKAKEILDLERKLCDAGDEKEAIVVTTTNLKEQELYLKKIFKIVKRIVEDEISSQIKLEELEVSHPEYFKNLYRIFYGDDKYQLVSAEVATDLVTWKLIEKYGWTISSEFEKKQLKFKKRQNISENVSREMKILQQLFTLAPLPLVRLYFDAVSFNEIAAQKMADDLKSSFNETVKSNDWMNNETKADVQAKLAKTNISVGYPELIKNDTQLDDLFSIKLKESDDAFELILKMENLKFINSLKPNQVDWSPFDQPLGTFSSEGNIIMLPLLFNGVFYGPERPEFSNFGAIGSFIAAKITPTFDTSLVAKWWKKETWQQFKPKIENMTKKYEITDVTTKLELNSNYSQNSDLADNAGLRVAHEAYVSRKLKEPKLPDFASWSEEKMFFLSYANSMCEVASNEYLREQIKHGHTPARYRVNIPLSNLQTFADAFQCKSDSKMNPKEKVRVW